MNVQLNLVALLTIIRKEGVRVLRIWVQTILGIVFEEAVEIQIAEAEAAQFDLEAEFAHRSRPEWIEEFARRELGMVPAKAEQFVRTVDLDGRVGPPMELRDADQPVDQEVGDAN